MNIKEEIKNLCKTKNAIILAHYYTKDEIQEVADYIGDSLALARYATTTDVSILVMCGVNFMAETCKILCPDKKVLIPDLNAGCSLADSCNASDLKAFLENNKDIKVVSYVNTTAEIKALSYICVTSGNAKKIIDSFPKDEKLLFCPDKNLGSYINKVTGRNMILWDGGCHVHGRFSREKIIELKEKHPNAKVLAHPECKEDILQLADIIGSTAQIIKEIKNFGAVTNEFIIVTEPGIFYELKRLYPEKIFISALDINNCEYMKMNTLENLYTALKTETPAIEIDEKLRQQAIIPIERMLERS